LLVPSLERQLGIEVYATRCSGIGGAIRRGMEDFVVEEMLVDGSRATIGQSAGMHPLGASSVKNRYLLCILVKRNWDTISAVKAVADQLGTRSGQIQFAGLKDTRAITAQHITIEDLAAQEIEKVHAKDIELRPVGYLRSELSQFYLLGNGFRIVIRGISRSEANIRKRVGQMTRELDQVGGFPNFFGHQRFGTTRPITHRVGKAIIKGDFKKAAMLFLAKPSPLEHSDSRQAREALQVTKDFSQALKDYPKQLRYERLMLRHLARRPHDFVGAFRRLPLKLLELFPQAYQSYLFNRFLSRRLTSGLKLNEAEAGDCAVNVERSGLPILQTYKIVKSDNIAEIDNAIQAGKMRLAIPLLGYKHKHSTDAHEETERQILEEEDVSLRNFKVDAIPEISLRGKLRAAVTTLNDFRLEEVAVDSVHPTRLAANMSFNLYRGSYATIVLRELMKPRNLVKAGF
jgi:tRNA pseudouridine13 synthase